ncbi:hypothetical protein E2320_015810 [Naja naja]|nr:hypothetical protein E2320_015810 [Naja naja]
MVPILAPVQKNDYHLPGLHIPGQLVPDWKKGLFTMYLLAPLSNNQMSLMPLLFAFITEICVSPFFCCFAVSLLFVSFNRFSGQFLWIC